jgi:hypothetical protein
MHKSGGKFSLPHGTRITKALKGDDQICSLVRGCHKSVRVVVILSCQASSCSCGEFTVIDGVTPS